MAMEEMEEEEEKVGAFRSLFFVSPVHKTRREDEHNIIYINIKRSSRIIISFFFVNAAACIHNTQTQIHATHNI